MNDILTNLSTWSLIAGIVSCAIAILEFLAKILPRIKKHNTPTTNEVLNSSQYKPSITQTKQALGQLGIASIIIASGGKSFLAELNATEPDAESCHNTESISPTENIGNDIELDAGLRDVDINNLENLELDESLAAINMPEFKHGAIDAIDSLSDFLS